MIVSENLHKIGKIKLLSDIANLSNLVLYSSSGITLPYLTDP